MALVCLYMQAKQNMASLALVHNVLSCVNYVQGSFLYTALTLIVSTHKKQSHTLCIQDSTINKEKGEKWTTTCSISMKTIW